MIWKLSYLPDAFLRSHYRRVILFEVYKIDSDADFSSSSECALLGYYENVITLRFNHL